MTHYRNWIILATVVFALVAVIPFAQVDPVALAKPNKPGLPECLATVAQLQQTIADQQAIIAEQEATIVALQEQIANLSASVNLPKTGQTIVYETGDDGNLQKGVALPTPRFTDNLNGTITDNLTG